MLKGDVKLQLTNCECRLLLVSRTIVVELFHVHDFGCVAEVDERLAVSPALNDDAARLRVERKQCTVEMTRRLHQYTEPPSHASGMMYVRVKQVEVVLRVETVSAAMQ